MVDPRRAPFHASWQDEGESAPLEDAECAGQTPRSLGGASARRSSGSGSETEARPASRLAKSIRLAMTLSLSHTGRRTAAA
jgi:hypothetical protein